METLLEGLSVLALSMVKFAVSAIWAYNRGFSYWETVFITGAGGCIGVLVFYRTSGWLMEQARQRKMRKLAKGGKPSRSFTRTNRIIVRVKRGQGMRGLAFLTPVLISIPIGAILAAKYFREDRRTLPTLISAVLVWAVVLSGFWQFTR